MSTHADVAPNGRGRPARYLLSGIATCAVCDAPMRVGSQNHTAQPVGSTTKPRRYKVYECAGAPGKGGFHVSVRQVFLDELVTQAVLARVSAAGFDVPRASREDPSGEERQALRLEIKGHRAWLETVEAAAVKQNLRPMYETQRSTVSPMIDAATKRLAHLEARDAAVGELLTANHVHETWRLLAVEQRRHIVQALVLPRIAPVAPEQRGQRSLDDRRVELIWRESA